MKLAFVLFAILGLSLASRYPLSTLDQSYSTTTKTAFTILTETEISQSSLISNLITFGSSQILATAISSQQIFAASDFRIDIIRQVSRFSARSHSLYRFHIRFVHIKFDSIFLETRFTLKYLLSSLNTFTYNDIALRSSLIFSNFNFGLFEDDTLRAAYQPLLNYECWRTSFAWQLLNYCNQYLWFQGSLYNYFTRLTAATSIFTALEISTINSVSIRYDANFAYYYYDVVFGDQSQSIYTINSKFIVAVSIATNAYSILSLDYQILDLIDKSKFGCPDYSIDKPYYWYDLLSSDDDSSDCSSNKYHSYPCHDSSYKKGCSDSRRSDCSHHY